MSFSRKVTLTKGQSYGGQLGRSGVSGPGLNPKHLKKPSTEPAPVLATNAADYVSGVTEKERDKITLVTQRIKKEREEALAKERGNREVRPHEQGAESYYPDYGYKSNAEASSRRRPEKKTDSKDTAAQQAILGVALAGIVLIGGLSQLGSCGSIRDDLKAIPSARQEDQHEVPKSILDF